MGMEGARLLVVGASAGIGRAIGTTAVGAGAEVVFAARRVDLLEAAVTEAGGGHAVRLDVCDDASVEAGVAEARRLVGGLDTVVFASGTAAIVPQADDSSDHWRRVMETNVVGAASVARSVLADFPGGGVYVVLGSSAVQRRRWGLTTYAASKAALDRLVEGLRDEHPEVRFVRAVIGSTTGTGFADDFDGEVLTDAMARWAVLGQHTRQMMEPQELSEVVVDVMATLRSHPGVAIDEVVIDPPGGPLHLPPTQDRLGELYDPPSTEG